MYKILRTSLGEVVAMAESVSVEEVVEMVELVAYEEVVVDIFTVIRIG